MTSAPTRDTASPIAALIDGAADRRGACPTLDVPMQTGDGLLSRVRIVGRTMTMTQLSALSRLAEKHGNGLVEVTARGNLQVRGLTMSSAAPFAQAVRAILEVDSGLVIDHSPLAGLDPSEATDPRPLVAAIRSGSLKMSDRLGPKVSVVIDAGGQVSLAGLKADIRLVAQGPKQWAVTLGGGKAQKVDEEGALATTLAVLGAMAAMGPDARATDLFPIGSRRADSAASPFSFDRMALTIGHSTPIGLAFGAARSVDLIALCEAASSAGVETLRLAPNHVLLLDNAPAPLIQSLAGLGFITRADDPRRSVSACIGNQGCASGHIAARQIASRLAPLAPEVQHLHVSGCSKGCAHPRRSDVTLVGRPDGIGLVIDGRAGDTPEQILDEAHLVDALARAQGAR